MLYVGAIIVLLAPGLGAAFWYKNLVKNGNKYYVWRHWLLYSLGIDFLIIAAKFVTMHVKHASILSSITQYTLIKYGLLAVLLAFLIPFGVKLITESEAIRDKSFTFDRPLKKAKEFAKTCYIRRLLFPAGFLAVNLSLLWTPADYAAFLYGKTSINTPFLTDKVTSFSRGIGQALLNGFDIFARVKNMVFYGFVYLPLLFLIVYGIVCLLLRRHKDDISDEAYSYVNKLTWVAFASLIIKLFNRFSPGIFSFFSLIPAIMIALLILYLRFFREKVPFERFKWCLFAALALEIPAIILIYQFGGNIDGFVLLVAFCSVGYLLLVLALTVLMYFLVRMRRDTVFCVSFTPIMAAPILLSVFLELTNVLNQYEIFITHKAGLSLLIVLLCALCGVAYYLKTAKRDKIINFDIGKWQYPLLIVSYAMLLVLPHMQITAMSTELFEASNYGSTIAGLFQFGQIPVVGNLGAHMLSDALGGILYGWLNNDAIGALYFSYSIFTPVLYLLFYYFFKMITDADHAVLLVLLFPLTALYGFSYYGLGLAVVLAALSAYKNESERSMLLFCLACAATCLYRMDLGAMFGISSVIALSIALLVKKSRNAFLRLWITGICTVASLLSLFVLLCAVSGISPLARLMEFLDIMMSSINWAYTTVADYSQWYYFFVYLIVPTAVVFCVFAVFIKQKKDKDLSIAKVSFQDSEAGVIEGSSGKMGFPATDKSQTSRSILLSDCLVLSILAIAYLVNFQRGIVRHNLLELAWDTFFATAPLCICIACYLIYGKKANVLSGCLSCVLVLQLLCGSTNVSGETLLQTSLNRSMDPTLYQEYHEKVDRVVISDGLKNAYMPLKLLLDATLNDHETFFDFTSDTLLYALTGREKPVYTNQSPSQLNSEYSQLMFIYEIASSDCPYALVPSYDHGFDGIPFRVNHYLVAEYLNQTYQPLCTISNYQLWVRKDCYEEKKALIQNLISGLNVRYQQINLSDYNLGSFVPVNDTSVTRIDKSLAFKNGITDPYVGGFDNNAALQQTMTNSDYLRIEIQYSSTTTGNFQCFYTLKDGENYSESQSVVVPVVDKKGTISFSIPCTKSTKIRFDFPNGSEFTIEKIGYAGISNDKWIDYAYEAFPHKYSIQYVPYYWGTYDKAEPQTVQAELCSGVQDVNTHSVKLDLSSIDLSKGNYIEILADSAAAGTADLRISSEKYGDLIDDSFNIVSGTQTRYLIRVSWDALWYSGLCNTLTISSDKKLDNMTIRVLQGDVDYNSMNLFDRLALKHLSLLD